MYDPSTAKFISEDPIGFDGGDDNLYRYVHNDPMNRIDPTGTSDVRFPFSSGVVNNSNQNVYIINSTERDDRIEVLRPGDATPNSLGRSKDADGVWIQKPSGWDFVPLAVPGLGEWGQVYIDSDLNVWGSDPEKVPNRNLPPSDSLPLSDYNAWGSQRDRNRNVLIEPWDGQNRHDPNHDGSPASRMRPYGIGTYPPDTRITYPDASEWEPVAPENTTQRPLTNLGQNGLERFIDQVRRTSGDIWDALTNPLSSDETTEGNVSQNSQDNSSDLTQDNQPPNPNRSC